MSLGLLRNGTSSKRVLNAYLLGRLDFDDFLNLQRRFVYDVADNPSRAALLLCEHPYGISIGRAGSSAHVLVEPDELRARGWPVQWVNRGGGCLLHGPGQVMVYPIVALDRLKLNVQQYLTRLHEVIHGVLTGLNVPAALHAGEPGVWVDDRRIAHVGVAVRDWVSYFGFAVNVDPDLKPFRFVHCDGEPRPMTSVERACRLRVRPATVRQRLLAAFAERFGFEQVSVFHHHPALAAKATAHAAAPRPA